LKNYVKWTIIFVIISVISACETNIVSQTPQNTQVNTKTDNTKTDNTKTDNTKTDNTKTDNTKTDNTKTDIENNDLPISTEDSNSPNKNTLMCQKALEERGQFSEQKGYADYKSGLRIFPLLDFIMTKHSLQAKHPEQSVFMKDNPIFVTGNDKYSNSLLFATIHSKRTGVLHGVIGFPDNEVTRYYEPMVFGSKQGFVPQVPATDLGPLNKSVVVNRKTWVNELAKYSAVCNDTLILPPTKTESPFFHYNGKIYPFSKEIDFVAGVEGVGFGLAENGNYYYDDEKKIQIPILFYCHECKIENIVMIQDSVELKFEDKYNSEWQKWLGKDWHAFTSEKIDFDEKVFAKAEFSKIHSDLPPFISDDPTTIKVTINGEKVEYVNQ
jgi:hypothetical protein